MIPSLDKIKRHREDKLIHVVSQDDLIICNYTDRCVFDNKWDKATMQCRGLILRVDKPWPDSTKITELVALPMAKFWNVGENGRYPTSDLTSVTEKVDGSLGIAFRDYGIWHVATRGSFTSEQALWATEYIRKKARSSELDKLPKQYTLLFEIIYPDNRVVVNYGDREELVLLACRDRFSGKDFDDRYVDYLAKEFGFNTPARYTDITSVEVAMAKAKTLGADMEGYVLRFSDGMRWKVKGDTYRYLAKLLQGISWKHVVESLMSGTIDSWLTGIPEEYQDEVKEWRKEVEQTARDRLAELTTNMATIPNGSRKEFAIFVQQRYPTDLWLYMILYDGKDIMQSIYKEILRDGERQA